MKKMKLIDLFNDITNGKKIPYKIKFDGRNYCYEKGDYEATSGISDILSEGIKKSTLNKTVEIIEMENKHPLLNGEESEYLQGAIELLGGGDVLFIEKSIEVLENKWGETYEIGKLLISCEVVKYSTYPEEESEFFVTTATLPFEYPDEFFKNIEPNKKYTLRELGL